MAYLLWHYLAESTRRYPSRPAVQDGTTLVPYQELDDLSANICASLKKRGIGRGSRVGLYMPKSWKSVAVMLGVSKAGAAYVPIDPNAPGSRAAYVLGDCAVSALITTNKGVNQIGPDLFNLTALSTVAIVDGEPGPDLKDRKFHATSWSDFTAAPSKIGRPEPAIESDPAYLLYTSGSTGFPKGVIISHRNAMSFVDWGADAFSIGPEDRLSNHAPLHFDLSVFDIFVALKCGATVVMVPDRVAAFPNPLAKWIEDQEISVWYSVPSALVRLLLHGDLEGKTYSKLRCVLYAGEPFPVKYLRRVMAAIRCARFFNLYGPTETNVCTYYALPSTLGDDDADIPIGQACANTHVFAVKDDGELTRPGETGELFSRGPTTMLGYWGQKERTQSAVVQNPLHNAYSDPVYRTGDIVSLQTNGNFVFVGRRDQMVKSRGYRIEIGDVEHALYEHDDVSEAAVVAIPDEEVGARLFAAVKIRDGVSVTESALVSFCRKRLPHYMVPEAIRVLSELPQTSTGKIDRVTLRERFGNSPSILR
jgi:amino acid adenylation domain-containing protein